MSWAWAYMSPARTRPMPTPKSNTKLMHPKKETKKKCKQVVKES